MNGSIRLRREQWKEASREKWRVFCSTALLQKLNEGVLCVILDVAKHIASFSFWSGTVEQKRKKRTPLCRESLVKLEGKKDVKYIDAAQKTRSPRPYRVSWGCGEIVKESRKSSLLKSRN